MFDKKHSYGPEKFKIFCGEATEVANAALAALKDHPDTEKVKEVKKLQEELKAVLKRA